MTRSLIEAAIKLVEGAREGFIHFSDAPLEAVRDAVNDAGSMSERMDKPRGLWFSVEGSDDGWKQWCLAEGFSTERLSVETEITFAQDANLLRLQSASDIDTFTREWGLESPYSRSYYGRGYGINWPALARCYDGIIIVPYCWERRLHETTHWYYSWDCASGCVWRASSVAALRARLQEEGK